MTLDRYVNIDNDQTPAGVRWRVGHWGDHAAVLARGTFIPARFWLALEHNYRAGLAAGLKDVTEDD